MLYVHHPSGPVGNATVGAFWNRPEWTDRPQGYDIPAQAGWYPIVTGIQEVADLIAGFSATSGYGHNYGIDFVTGWAAVAPPDGWTTADSVRLHGTSRPSSPAVAKSGRDGSLAPWPSRNGTCSLSPRVNSLVGSRR